MEKLGINLGLLISQIFNFTLLAVILYLLLYKPVLRMLSERKERIRKSMDDVELAAKRAAEADQAYERKLEEARKEGQRIIAQATETGQKVAVEIRAQAQAEATEIVRKANEDRERQRDQMALELRREAGDLAIAIARQLISSTVDEGAQRKLVAKFLAETEGLS